MDVDAICIEKLTPEDRQRCFNNNLCFKCCRPGHIASRCRNPFTNKQKQTTTTTTKIKEIPNNIFENKDSATIGKISTMDF